MMHMQCPSASEDCIRKNQRKMGTGLCVLKKIEIREIRWVDRWVNLMKKIDFSP